MICIHYTFIKMGEIFFVGFVKWGYLQLDESNKTAY